jgi:pyruvoyl-dependent arginine decarboxylase (PvlArgDC)
MINQLTSGFGAGETELSALGLALHQFGMAHFALTDLSSIIPPGSAEIEQRFEADAENFGDRLYFVIAHHRVSHRNEGLWDGLGWVQSLESGGGFFAEHAGAAQTR